MIEQEKGFKYKGGKMKVDEKRRNKTFKEIEEKINEQFGKS